MRRFAAFGCVVLLLVACGSAIGRGTTLYQQHNYVEAAEVFERTQDRLATMEPADRARYGLYRGLTFMALGDLRNAEHWLDYAESQQHVFLGSLAQNERGLLNHGRLELSQRVREAWPKPARESTQGLATSTSPSDRLESQRTR